MQNHLLKVTRKAEKLEFHGLLNWNLYRFYSFAFKERKMFSAVKKSISTDGPISSIFISSWLTGELPWT